MARPTLLEQKEKYELEPKKQGRPVTTTKSAILALQHRALSKLGPTVFKRLGEALENPSDPLHAKAIELVLERVAPKGYWSQLAEKELGGGGTRPSITITINGGASISATDQQQDDVVDVDFVDREED